MGKYFSLTFYEKQTQPGEFWIRTPDNRIVSAIDGLKNVFEKYKYATASLPFHDNSLRTFYQDITEPGYFTRFDVIQDVIFVETQRGTIFDQIEVKNNIIYPKTQDNNFTTSLKSNRLRFPDYWFDEINRKIFITTYRIEAFQENTKGLRLGYFIEEYDMKRSILDVKNYFTVEFDFNAKNFYTETPISEPAKLTYNRETKMFNISHICRGPKKEFGLVSINVLKDQDLSVKNINAFFSFQKTTNVIFNPIIQKKMTIDSDNQ